VVRTIIQRLIRRCLPEENKPIKGVGAEAWSVFRDKIQEENAEVAEKARIEWREDTGEITLRVRHTLHQSVNHDVLKLLEQKMADALRPLSAQHGRQWNYKVFQAPPPDLETDKAQFSPDGTIRYDDLADPTFIFEVGKFSQTWQHHGTRDDHVQWYKRRYKDYPGDRHRILESQEA
jgi:hypothetical protein